MTDRARPKTATERLRLAGARPSPRLGAIATCAAVLLVGALAVLVHATGGTQYAYLHLLYVPIFLAATYGGVPGGLAVAVLAGLAVGPLVPHNVEAGIPQHPVNWLLRMGLFMLVAVAAAAIVAQLRREADRLRWHTLHSMATGLPNRRALTDRLRELRQPQRWRLALVRIVNYEEIVNALGAGPAEQLTAALARRLRRVAGTDDAGVFDLTAATLATLLPNEATGTGHLGKLRDLAEAPLKINGVPVYAELAVGVTALGHKPPPPQELVQRGNLALQQAIRHSTFYAEYAYSGEESQRQSLELLSRLPQAMRHRELELHYQPKVDLATGRPVGLEALLRWHHPELGRIPPAQFIPLVENTALIHPLTRWVVREAVQYLAHLRSLGFDISVAVNLSPRNLADPELFGDIATILRENGVPHTALELEITESAVLEVPQALQQSLEALRHQGLTVSLDDFGTGFTTLQHLAELPVDSLKIDQVFVRRLHWAARHRDVVDCMIQLAHRLGLHVVAEGIEDEQAAKLLQEMGCTVGQGYLYAPPLTSSTLEQWLRAEPDERFATTDRASAPARTH